MKTYLLISPQAWGKMYLSKHNYAMELAKAGHRVYFLNPPTYVSFSTRLNLQVKEERPNLFLLDYLLAKPLHVLRFKARPVYDYVMEKTLVKALNKLGPFDAIWCFEPNIFSSFRAFKARKKLLFLVDQHANKALERLGREADGIATVSSLILDYFGFTNRPKLLINHGLNDTFNAVAKRRLAGDAPPQFGQTVRVAYVGNLLQGDRMDHQALKKIVAENADVEFHIYGPFEEKGNTLVATYTESLKQFLLFLKSQPHVKLHGVLPQTELAKEMESMDAFLTCYNYETDINKSSNCHKLIEYLATGRVVVANRIIMYENTEGLLEMPAEYTNENLPAIFRRVVTNLAIYNAAGRQQARAAFALQNTYKKHTETLSHFLETGTAPAASTAIR